MSFIHDVFSLSFVPNSHLSSNSRQVPVTDKNHVHEWGKGLLSSRARVGVPAPGETASTDTGYLYLSWSFCFPTVTRVQSHPPSNIDSNNQMPFL